MKVNITLTLPQLLAQSILLICLPVESSDQRETVKKTHNTTAISSSNNLSVNAQISESSTQVPVQRLDLRVNVSVEINILENVTSFTNETLISPNRLKGKGMFSESPIIDTKTASFEDFNTTENSTVLATTLNNSVVDYESTKPLYSVLTSFKNKSTNIKLNKLISTILPSTKSPLTSEQIEVLERNFKFMLLSRTGSQQNELDDVMTEDEPFGSAILRNKKYLSVMIPIGVGITGAMVIIVMAFASKIRKTNSRADRTSTIPRIFTQSIPSENKPDDVILLKDSSDDEL